MFSVTLGDLQGLLLGSASVTLGNLQPLLLGSAETTLRQLLEGQLSHE